LRIRERLRFSEGAFHLLLAGGVGVIGGLVNLLFYYATESVGLLFFRHSSEPSEAAELMVLWQRVLTPTLGGLCAGLVLHWGRRLAGPERSTNLLEVVVAGDGRLPFRNGMVKFISSLITIGSGGSIGREGGITQVTATFASKWGQLARWHPYRLRLLVGCGAASGIAAAYNAPISGAVFAALIVLGNFSMNLFAPLVFASVVATMVSRSFFGIQPWYTVPPFDFTRITQLPWFLFLGILTGAMGAAFLKLLNQSEALFQRLKAPIYVRLAIGGLVVGVIALGFPGVWGNGYVITNRILQGEYTSLTLSPRDVLDLPSFAGKLRHPDEADSVSHFVASELSVPTRDLIAQYTGGVNPRLQRALVNDLNRLILGDSIWETNRFAQVTIPASITNLLKADLQGAELARFNRSLLLAAYPKDLAVHNRYSKGTQALLFLSGLLLAKLVATMATVGAGAVGGVFTPTLFLGASLGALCGLSLRELSLAQGLPISVFALVGMGSMLSATTRSPLLAMIMIFEISLDYSLMPPLMLACVVSVLVARRLHPESIYTEPLRRKGLTLSEEIPASEAAAQRTVSDLMRAPVAPVRENSPLSEIVDRFLTGANNFLPVVDAKGALVGLVALQDLKEHLGSGEEVKGIIAYDLMRPPPACVTPSQRLLEVLPVVLASEQRNIPVVNTLKENLLVGALVRAEVLSVFSEAIAASGKSDA
jgi:H+/Cl- antiporter ClcA/predicted transcriptional regulator